MHKNILFLIKELIFTDFKTRYNNGSVLGCLWPLLNPLLTFIVLAADTGNSNAVSTRWINLEFANYCNLRCKWCTLDHKKEKILMKEDLLKNFLADLINDEHFRSVEQIDLHNAGETLLNPKLINMLKIIKKYKDIAFKRKQRFPKIALLTNGILLSESLSERIIKTNCLDLIRFSVDRGNEERYEQIRMGAKFEVIFKNISKFIEMNRGKIKTGIICMIDYDRPASFEWMSPKFRELIEKVDHVEIRYPHNWDGSKEFDITEKAKSYYARNKASCKFLVQNLVILPNGDVTVCCADLNSRGVIGNLYQQHLFEIWSSPKRKKMLELFKKGKKNKIDLCKDCTGY